MRTARRHDLVKPKTLVRTLMHELAHHLDFPRGKIAGSDAFELGDWLYTFNIDADRANGGDGEKSQPGGVRIVEMNLSSQAPHRRFSVLSIDNLYIGWSLPQITAEQQAQYGTADDEVVAIFGKMKSRGSRFFCRRQQGLKARQLRAEFIRGGAEDVDLVLGQSHCSRRIGPGDLRRKPRGEGSLRHSAAFSTKRCRQG